MEENDQIEDVEKEEGNENVKIERPFNPNDININIVPRNIGQLVEMLEYNEILIPKYQRLPNLWSDKKKSRFIESLMLDLPIPLFYFDEGEDKKWRVIDGLQRISTLEHFILGSKKNRESVSGNYKPLVLQELEFLSDFNEKTWEQLPREMKRRILTNLVTINLIGKGTPERVKNIIFNRINQGSTSLQAQEIRTALFQGYRMDFIETLVSLETDEGKAFIKATDSSIKTRRQGDLDFVTRFISFYLIDFKKYEPDLDSFLTNGTEAIPDEFSKQVEIKLNFKKAMDLAFEVFSNDAFRKRVNKNDSRNPINKPIFEVITTVFAKISDNERQIIKSNKDIFRDCFINLQKNNSVFWNAITTGTATKESVTNRHTTFNSMLKDFFNDTENRDKKL